MASIDYLTLSLGQLKDDNTAPTNTILSTFAAILPQSYRETCKGMICSNGRSQRVNQYGINVSLQYGKATKKWMYSVQLSGVYFEAIKCNREAIIKILDDFMSWRVARLDLQETVLVPIEDWREYYKAAFSAGDYALNGVQDSRTVYYGSRKSQFYTRIYNKTAADPAHFPAPAGKVQIRFEIEIKRVSGDLILDKAFLDPVFADRLFIQRVRHTTANDGTGLLAKYFDSGEAVEKIETVERVVGDFESTVDYIFRTYEPYILAGLKSKSIKKKLKGKASDPKVKKILAVLDHSEKGGGLPHD